MDRFAVRYALIGEAQESLARTGVLVEGQLGDLDAFLGPLRARWTGEAAANFDAARAEWMRAAEGMAENLAGLAELLARIDENYRSAHRANLSIWGGGGSGSSSGPASTVAMSAGAGSADEVDVSIEELRRCARSFYGLQQRLTDNMAWVSRNLSLNAADMAGADPVLAPWRQLYDDVARDLWAVLKAGADVLGGMAQGMTDTGNNYVDAELASTAGHGGAIPERLPDLRAHEVRPASALPASAAPSPAKPMEDWAYDYWPDGHPDKLLYAAGEWNQLAKVLLEVSSSGDALVRGLVEENRGEVFDRIQEYWESKSQLCGTAEIFSALQKSCTSLSNACRLLAKAVKAAQEGMRSLDASIDDLGVLEVIAYFKHPLAKAAEVGVELGKWLATLAITDQVKDAYELGRGEAVAALSQGSSLSYLRKWAQDAEAVTVESERRAYEQVDRGLEDHLGEAPYNGWEEASEPHPEPASVHITAGRAQHIVEGDPPPARGGGHGAGVGKVGKTEFPPGWDRPLILSHIRDVARNPDQPPRWQSNGRWVAYGVRDGVLIRVVVNPDGSVRTAFPLSGPGVAENPREKN